jgi:hypothetical protein
MRGVSPPLVMNTVNAQERVAQDAGLPNLSQSKPRNPVTGGGTVKRRMVPDHLVSAELTRGVKTHVVSGKHG